MFLAEYRVRRISTFHHVRASSFPFLSATVTGLASFFVSIENEVFRRQYFIVFVRCFCEFNRERGELCFVTSSAFLIIIIIIIMMVVFARRPPPPHRLMFSSSSFRSRSSLVEGIAFWRGHKSQSRRLSLSHPLSRQFLVFLLFFFRCKAGFPKTNEESQVRSNKES